METPPVVAIQEVNCELSGVWINFSHHNDSSVSCVHSVVSAAYMHVYLYHPYKYVSLIHDYLFQVSQTHPSFCLSRGTVRITVSYCE